MAKVYQPILGEVQQFPDQPEALIVKDVNGKTVREFWIKSPVTQKAAKVTVWPNVAPALELKAGDWVVIGAAIEVNGEFTNITARTIGKVPIYENDDDREPQTVRKNREATF